MKKQVGMVWPKSTQTRLVGIIADEMYPHILFLSNRVSMKMCRAASHLLLSLLILFVYFLAIPSLLTSSNYLVTLHTCLCSFFSSIATESEGVWSST